MSRSEVERFAADLKSNAALRSEAEKNEAAHGHMPPLSRATAFAASKGYSFTVGHAREHVKATAKASGKQLTDAELDGVVGAGNCIINPEQFPGPPPGTAAP
jgi:hypothetical protein